METKIDAVAVLRAAAKEIETLCSLGFPHDVIQRRASKALADTAATDSASTVAKDTAGEELSQKQIARILHDYPTWMQFWSKHALGPLAAPSCLVCGQMASTFFSDPHPSDVVIQHLELPGIVVCRCCRDKALAAPISEDTGNCAASVEATLPCWSCKKPYTAQQRSDADGQCPHCDVEIELDDNDFAEMASGIAPAAPSGSIGEDSAAVAGVEVARPDLAKLDKWSLSLEMGAMVPNSPRGKRKFYAVADVEALFAAPDTPNPTKEAK